MRKCVTREPSLRYTTTTPPPGVSPKIYLCPPCLGGWQRVQVAARGVELVAFLRAKPAEQVERDRVAKLRAALREGGWERKDQVLEAVADWLKETGYGRLVGDDPGPTS